MGVVAKRSAMTFYSDPTDHYSHCVRIVLAEKGVTVKIENLKRSELYTNDISKELLELNPYGTIPTLVDRDLVLDVPIVMMEYLDERFPHPPLFSVYPVARAKSRTLIHRIKKEWFPVIDVILDPASSEEEKASARKGLADGLTSISDVVAEKPFFMSDELTVVDCCLAPILWRLPILGIELEGAKPRRNIQQYKERIFDQDSFQASLSEEEKLMNPEHTEYSEKELRLSRSGSAVSGKTPPGARPF